MHPYWDHLVQLIKEDNFEELQNQLILDPSLVFVTDKRDNSLLIRASIEGSVNCVRLLVEHKSEINKQNIFKNTALSLSVFNKNYEVADFLFQQGADPSNRNEDDESAIDHIVELNHSNPAQWIKLFGTYKDKLDKRDLACYHTFRLQALFSPD